GRGGVVAGLHVRRDGDVHSPGDAGDAGEGLVEAHLLAVAGAQRVGEGVAADGQRLEAGLDGGTGGPGVPHGGEHDGGGLVVEGEQGLGACAQRCHGVRTLHPGRAVKGRRRVELRARPCLAQACRVRAASRACTSGLSIWMVACSKATGKWVRTHSWTSSRISIACDEPKHSSATTTCSERIGRLLPTLEACRSWTSWTCSRASRCSRTSSRSTPSGVYSMRIRRVSRRTRTARGTMSAAMNSPASASACWNPVYRITSAATITPRDPSASLATSRKAA